MKFLSTTALRESEDFKELFVQMMELHEITDKELASVFGVSVQTVGRWKNPLDETNLPAFTLHMFKAHEEKYKSFAVDLLNHFCDTYDRSIIPNIQSINLNGTLTDEIIQGATYLGELAKHAKLTGEEALRSRAIAEKFIQVGFAMKAEILEKVKR